MTNQNIDPQDSQLEEALAILRDRSIPNGPGFDAISKLEALLHERSHSSMRVPALGWLAFSGIFRRAIAAVLIIAFTGAVLWMADRRQGTAFGDEIQTVQIQVSALQMLHDLHATPDQIRALRKLASDTQASANDLDGADPHATTAPAYKQALSQLHDALLGEDENKIDAAQDKVDKLEEQHDIDAEADIAPTESARAKAIEALKLFTPTQIGSYIAANSDDIPDATDVLVSAMTQCRQETVDDFPTMREETAEQIGLLVGGLPPRRSRPIAKSVSELLNKTRGLSDSDFSQQRSDLEKSAREITSNVDPVDSLRHWLLGQTMALLSNPQLEAVVTDKLQHQH